MMIYNVKDLIGELLETSCYVDDTIQVECCRDSIPNSKSN